MATESEKTESKDAGSIDYNDSAANIAKEKAKAADQDAKRLREESE